MPKRATPLGSRNAQKQPINLEAQAASLPDLWSPKVVAQVADQYLKVARVHGEFDWHAHEHEDELFLVIKGLLVIELRNGNVTLESGDVFVVPAGVEHRPVAHDEALIALFEPVQTLHTGGAKSQFTRSIEEQLAGGK